MSNHSDTKADPKKDASDKHETRDSLTSKDNERSETVGFVAGDTETDIDTLTRAEDE